VELAALALVIQPNLIAFVVVQQCSGRHASDHGDVIDCPAEKSWSEKLMSGHKAQLSAALAAASVPCPDYEVRDLGDERLTEDQPRYLATVEVPPHRRASGLLQEDGEPEFFMASRKIPKT
jgi:hypothetical protein